MKKRVLLLVLGFAVYFAGSTQTRFTGWAASFNTIKTGRKTSIHSDMQLRSTGQLRQMQTLLLRAGMNYHFSKKLSATMGYAWVLGRHSVGGVNGHVPEHRIWQQLLVQHQLAAVSVSHRFRTEQRFIAKSQVVNDQLQREGSVYANRFRYFIRNMRPFRPQPSFRNGVFAALQNEVFMNFGNTANVNGEFFDQNRFYLALGLRVNTGFDIEAGYLNQYVNGRGSSFTNNHVAQLAGYLRF